MKSPSSIKYINIADSTKELINSVVFSSNKVVRNLKENYNPYLFIGNAVHSYIEFIYDKFTINQAKVSALIDAKLKHPKPNQYPIKLTNNLNDVFEHNIKFAVNYLNTKVVEAIELRTYWIDKYESIFNKSIGGTADIVIKNNNGTYTIADFKNYENPNSDDLRKHYTQVLVYANMLALQNDWTIQDIQIVYCSQEQVITLPYEVLDLRTV